MSDYGKLKVADLKKLLTERDLAINGLKADLVGRLEQDDKDKAAAEAAPEEPAAEEPTETKDEGTADTQEEVKEDATAEAPTESSENQMEDQSEDNKDEKKKEQPEPVEIVPGGRKLIPRRCPSISKGEPCWALSRGKPCNYANHTRPGEEGLTHVYVAHLPKTHTEADLEELYSRFGPIKEYKILVNTRTNESKGVGFVHFENHDDAVKAIAETNVMTIPGAKSPLLVKFAVRKGAEKAVRDVRDVRYRGRGRGGGRSRKRPPPPRRFGGYDDYYDDYDFDYGPPPPRFRGPPGYGPMRRRRPPPPRPYAPRDSYYDNVPPPPAPPRGYGGGYDPYGLGAP